MKKLNETSFELVPLAKIGNHTILNSLFEESSQIKVIDPGQSIEGLTTYLFYQRQGTTQSILRRMVLNVPEGNKYGYGRFGEGINDAVLAIIEDDEVKVIIMDGERGFTLQYYQLLKEGRLGQVVTDLMCHLPC